MTIKLPVQHVISNAKNVKILLIIAHHVEETSDPITKIANVYPDSTIQKKPLNHPTVNPANIHAQPVPLKIPVLPVRTPRIGQKMDHVNANWVSMTIISNAYNAVPYALHVLFILLIAPNAKEVLISERKTIPANVKTVINLILIQIIALNKVLLSF